MIRRTAALVAALCALAAALVVVSGGTSADTARLGDVSIEICDGLDDVVAERIAEALTSPEVDWVETTFDRWWGGDTEVEKLPAAVEAGVFECFAGSAHNSGHSMTTTRAYYTKHLLYDKNPRCEVSVYWVCACRECSYVGRSLESVSRVSFCHPYGAPTMPGDVNRDGRVNAKDVILMMKRVVGSLSNIAVFDPAAADLNNDGKINARDVIKTMSLALSQYL